MADDLIYGGSSSNGSASGGDSLAPAKGYNYDFTNSSYTDRVERVKTPFDPVIDLLHLNGIQDLFGSSDTLSSGNPFGGNPFQFNPLANTSNSVMGSGNSNPSDHSGGFGGF